MSKILIVDNYDSFTQNLRHMVYSVSGIDAHIVKNDEDIQLIESEYDAVVISRDQDLWVTRLTSELVEMYCRGQKPPS